MFAFLEMNTSDDMSIVDDINIIFRLFQLL